MVEELIYNWLIIAFIGAVITSFNAPMEEDCYKNFGHYMSWVLFPILFIVFSLISLIIWDLKFLKFYYMYLVKNDDDEI